MNITKSDRPRDVLHLASYCGGSQLYRHLFDSLGDLEFRQTVVSPRGPVAEKFRSARCRMVDDPIWSGRHRLLFGTKVARYVDHLESSRVLDVEGQLIHAHTLFSDGFAARRVAARYGLDYVVSVRSTDLNIFARFFPHLRAEARQVLREASAVIFLNRPYIRKLGTRLNIDLHDDRTRVIPNGIDDFWLTAPCDGPVSGSGASDDGESVRIVSVGNVLRKKNHRLLIRAVRSPGNDERRLTLTIIGSHDTPYGRRLVREFEGADIRFTGALDREALRGELHDHDVFALVSRLETFGLVYAEALSQGLPIIYTEGQGFDGWTDDEDIGHACRSDDARQVRASAIELARKRERGHVRKRRDLAERFRWSDVAEEVMDTYEFATR